MVSVHLLENFCPCRRLNMNFTQEGVRKSCIDLKTHSCICLSLANKTVGEQPMKHNCASLCSLCEGKDGAKTIYISYSLTIGIKPYFGG